MNMKRISVVLLLVSLLGGGCAADASSVAETPDRKDEHITVLKDDKTPAPEEKKEDTDDSESYTYAITDTVFNYYTNSIGNTEYYGIVEITNTGAGYLWLKDCSFDLEDDDGHLLQTGSMISSTPDVLAPGQKGYFYNGVLECLIDDGVSLDNGVNLVPNFDIVAVNEDSLVEYEVTDTDLRQGNLGFPCVTGRVENKTDEDKSYLYLTVLFFDENDKIKGITGTSITGLDAGKKISFECSCMYMDKTVSDKADQYRYQVIASATSHSLKKLSDPVTQKQ